MNNKKVELVVLKLMHDIAGPLLGDSYEWEIEESFWDNGMDDIDIVDLIMRCERHFNITIPDDDIPVLNNYRPIDLIRYISGRLN